MQFADAYREKVIVRDGNSLQTLRPMNEVTLGMIGCGTVGSGVFHHLQQNGALLQSRLGVKISMRKIAVKAFDEPRPYDIPKSLMTTDWTEVVNDPQINVIIEL